MFQKVKSAIKKAWRVIVGSAVAGTVAGTTILGGMYGISKYNPQTGALEALPVAPGAKIDTVQIEDWMPKELLKPDRPMPLDSGDSWGIFAVLNDTVFCGVIGKAAFSYNMTLKATPNRLNKKGIRK